MDIDTMPAGREMDRLIALLMGSQVVDNEWIITKDAPNAWKDLPCYSTDIAAAWLVWEKILPSKNIGEWMIAALWSGTTPPVITGWQIVEERYRDYETETKMIASGETAPLAICRAVLKATGYLA